MSVKVKKRMLNRSRKGNAAIFVLLSLMGIFMILPMVYSVSSALKPLNELWYFPPRFFVENPTLRNFKELFGVLGDSWVPFSRYLFNTLFVSVLGTFGHVILSSLCAYALAKHRFPGQAVIFNIIVLSLMFNTTVTLVPTFLIMCRLSLVNSYWSLILPAFAAPLGLYLMKQFMETNIPDTLIEAAHIDGANEWVVFWRMVMPLVKPAWLTLIISCQNLWKTATNARTPREPLKPRSSAPAQIVSGGIARTGTAAAATVIMMVVPIIIFLLSQSNVMETVATSGMKD